jgi:peptidoglycan/xylan/chitin deacetylase (PgdA/CDA1 family)
MKGATQFKAIREYREIKALTHVRSQLFAVLRRSTIWTMAQFPVRKSTKNWIRFPFYHHVFDDERKGFEAQLRFYRNYGEFISLEKAVAAFEGRDSIDGRFFCITFDDGFKCCAKNGLPILVEHECQAAFFVSTDYVGCNLPDDVEKMRGYFKRTSFPKQVLIEFLDWEECRALERAGMTIGSHTQSHSQLTKLDIDQVHRELLLSKRKIEQEVGAACDYFAAPWGLPRKHVDLDLHPPISREIGYKAFLTTERGANAPGTDPFKIKRDFILAEWGSSQLRYLLLY